MTGDWAEKELAKIKQKFICTLCDMNLMWLSVAEVVEHYEEHFRHDKGRLERMIKEIHEMSDKMDMIAEERD